MKFEEAYCTTLNRCVTVDEIQVVYKKQPKRYAIKYATHLICPDCGKVQLAYCDSKLPFLFPYPGGQHAKDCYYNSTVYTDREIRSLLKNNPHEIQRQLQQFFDIYTKAEGFNE